jgi:hypothetical protein
MTRTYARALTAAAWTFGAILSCSTAVAQGDRVELSVLVVPAASYSSVEGFELDHTFGLGAGWRFAPRWSVELRGLGGETRTDLSYYKQRTFELGLRRRLGASPTWRPFLQAGPRYRTADSSSAVVCSAPIASQCPATYRIEHEELGAFVGGGVDWLFSRNAALRFDGRLAMYDSEVTGSAARDVDLTLGLALRF